MYQLEPALLMCDFNFEMIMAVVTPLGTSNQVDVIGHFRSKNDFGGMIWHSEDEWSHPHLRYRTEKDFSNVILEYDYTITGSMVPLDEIQGQSLTVINNDGVHYVRLWNYVMGRPLQYWEEAGDVLFPEGRTLGTETGIKGHIKLDFNNLYAGWAQYEWDGEGWSIPPNWYKIDPTTIKEIRWGFVHVSYTGGDRTPLPDSAPFKMIFKNWTVHNAKDIGSPNPRKKHCYRLADGYDDSYNVTPERYIRHFHDLGFRKWINLYIGASHYYDKKGVFDELGNPISTPGEHVPYLYEQKKDPVFNSAFEAWFTDLCKRAAALDFTVVGSYSFESVDAPADWWQYAYDGEPATSGWTPTPHFVTFTNPEVQQYYKKYALGIADIQSAAGLTPCIQAGEPWWWIQGDKPCFYDEYTKNKYRNETGSELPIYTKTDVQGYDKEAIAWLGAQNGLFQQRVRDHIRDKYPQALFTLLIFLPTVDDKMGHMMKNANVPVEHWKNISTTDNLNFIQIEDYDWIIGNDPLHDEAYDYAWNTFKYQCHRTQYFSGFVLNPESITSSLWKRINEALIEGINNEFETYIWAGMQIRRDGWEPPPLIWKTQQVGVLD